MWDKAPFTFSSISKSFFHQTIPKKGGGGGSREVEDVYLAGQEYTAVGEFSAFRSKSVYFENISQYECSG